MGQGEGKFAVGFLLLGLAPLFVTAGWGLAAGIFAVGIIISTSAAF